MVFPAAVVRLRLLVAGGIVRGGGMDDRLFLPRGTIGRIAAAAVSGVACSGRSIELRGVDDELGIASTSAEVLYLEMPIGAFQDAI